VLRQSEHGDQGIVDCPKFVGGEAADPAPETLDVDCAELFDENPGGFTSDRDLGPE
jgi:hypothetical protein